MPDYSKGKIYTIRNRNDDTLIYVGSTVNPLYKRLGQHKTDSKTKISFLLYSTINNDWNDWYIELYQEYPCENREQLCKREGEIIREIGTLNKQITGRTQKEYKQENAEKINEYKKKWREDNADEIKEKKKEYHLNNADKKKEYDKEYRKANAEKKKEIDKEYRKNNAEKYKEYMKEYRQRKKLEKQQNMVQQN